MAAGHVPEHDLGQLVAAAGIVLLRVLEVRELRVSDAGVKLHVGDDIELGGQLALGHTVLHSRLEDQVEYRLQVGVGNLVEGGDVPQPIGKGLALDLDQLRAGGELDEMIAVGTLGPLGKVQTQGKRHGGGEGRVLAVHGAGGVHHGQGVLAGGEVLQRRPGGVEGELLLLAQGTHEAFLPVPCVLEAGLHDLIGQEGAGVQLRLAPLHLLHESAVALAVVAPEGPAVLEHGLGGLLGVVEGVILLPQVVLQDPDPGAQTHQRLAVVPVRQAEGPGDLLCQRHRLRVGGVHRGEPLAQQGNVAALLQGGQVRLKLLLQQGESRLAAGGVQQHQHIVPAAVLRDVGEISHHGARLVEGEPAEDDAKDAPLAQAAPDVPGEEQDLHGQIPVLRIGLHEALFDLQIALPSQGADGGEKIQAVLPGAAVGQGAVFGIGFVCDSLQEFQHGKDLLYK